MAHSQSLEPALVLIFSKTSKADGTRFSFALEHPDRLAADRAVRSPNVSYEGHAWNIVCKRQKSGKFGIEVELVLKNTDRCLTCRIDFTLSILRRRMCTTPGPICDVRNRDFTGLQPRHGEPEMISFHALVNSDEGYSSSISPWVKLELVMSKCVSMFEASCDARIGSVVNGKERSIATFNLSDCQLRVYFDMNIPKEPKICIQGESQAPYQEYSLELAYTITVSDTVIMSTRQTHIHVQTDKSHGNGIPCLISEPAPESEGKVTAKIEVVSFQPATNVRLALPTKFAIKGSQRSFQDPLGNCWKMYVQKQNGKISVKISLFELCGSWMNLSHDYYTAWLQWKALIVPRKRQTETVPFNDGNDLLESFFKGTSSLIEYTMRSSLELTQVSGHSSPFRRGKDKYNKLAGLVVRIEYINLQPGVLVPGGKFPIDCELTKMDLSELNKLLVDLRDEQHSFKIYRKACEKLEQRKENINNLQTKMATETCKSQSLPHRFHVREDIRPSTNESGRSTISSPIQAEIERLTAQVDDLRRMMKKMETESTTRPSSSRPRKSEHFVSDEILDEVAENLGGEWKSLGRQHLGLPESDLHECVAGNPNSVHEQIYQMLRKWKHREGLKATEGVLFAKLQKAKVGPDALEVFDYLLE